MDHENTVKASCLGALGCLGSPSAYLNTAEIFAVSTCLRFSSSAGRWRYRWDLLDNKYVEKNETRRHGGMYFIAKIRNLHSDIASKKAVYGIQNLPNGL
jgi:hypothetical protein